MQLLSTEEARKQHGANLSDTELIDELLRELNIEMKVSETISIEKVRSFILVHRATEPKDENGG